MNGALSGEALFSPKNQNDLAEVFGQNKNFEQTNLVFYVEKDPFSSYRVLIAQQLFIETKMVLKYVIKPKIDIKHSFL